MKAFLFPGQGSQQVGMGEDLLIFSGAQEYMEMADDILGYKLSEIMKTGTMPELKQTKITQPAVYVYSVIKARCKREFKPDMVAGHSLGEFSALAAVRSITYADGLRLVKVRAEAMQAACEAVESGMAAVLGLENENIEAVLEGITEEVVVPANYNCPGQLVISGSVKGLEIAKERLIEAGARTVLPLKNVSGAFHSPLMQPAADALEQAIMSTDFKVPSVPVYQNVTARPTTDPDEIRQNLIAHLTSPVRWTDTIENMVIDEATQFFELGARPVLGSMVKRINSRFTPVAI